MALDVHLIVKKSKLSLDVKILGLWAVGVGWKEKDEKESENLWSENFCCDFILGDPGADSGDEGKSKRAEKYDTKKSKERREKHKFSGTNQKPERRRPLELVW